MIRYPYTDDSLIANATGIALAHNVTVLQIHRFADQESEHCRILLDALDPPVGAVVADLGSGVGGVEERMRWLRQDLTFIEINASHAQLQMSPGQHRLRADFHHVPLADASCDAAMLLYSLGHGDPPTVLAEAARILKPGGRLLLHDLVAIVDGSEMAHSLKYEVGTLKELMATINDIGMTMEFFMFPKTTMRHMRGLMTKQQRKALKSTLPVVATFRRNDASDS